jgi:hypothetical protein
LLAREELTAEAWDEEEDKAERCGTDGNQRANEA